MDVLIEVHSLKELKEVSGLSCEMIGINNRNLDTFEVDLATTLQIAPFTPKESGIVSESGISSLKDILVLKGAGVDAVLLGEVLMRAKDIKEKIKELHVGCKG